MTSYTDICWAYLQEKGFITAWAISNLTKTTCPHDVIRKIRKRYGYNILAFKDIKKVKTYTENGKEKRETKTFRIWFLNKKD